MLTSHCAAGCGGRELVNLLQTRGIEPASPGSRISSSARSIDAQPPLLDITVAIPRALDQTIAGKKSTAAAQETDNPIKIVRPRNVRTPDELSQPLPTLLQPRGDSGFGQGDVDRLTVEEMARRQVDHAREGVLGEAHAMGQPHQPGDVFRSFVTVNGELDGESFARSLLRTREHGALFSEPRQYLYPLIT